MADGQAFSDGCVGDWGGGDYKDLMAGLDHALEANPWIDSERLGVCGGSCETAAPLPALHLPLVRLRPHAVCCWVRTDGGYMTMWIATQTKRFNAAVSHAGLSNHISFCERPPHLSS